MHCAERFKWPDNKRTVGLRKVNGGDREKRELRMDASFKNNDGNECRSNADDAMMRCNKQIKNTTDSQNKESI